MSFKDTYISLLKARYRSIISLPLKYRFYDTLFFLLSSIWFMSGVSYPPSIAGTCNLLDHSYTSTIGTKASAELTSKNFNSIIGVTKKATSIDVLESLAKGSTLLYPYSFRLLDYAPLLDPFVPNAHIGDNKLTSDFRIRKNAFRAKNFTNKKLGIFARLFNFLGLGSVFYFFIFYFKTFQVRQKGSSHTLAYLTPWEYYTTPYLKSIDGKLYYTKGVGNSTNGNSTNYDHNYGFMLVQLGERVIFLLILGLLIFLVRIFIKTIRKKYDLSNSPLLDSLTFYLSKENSTNNGYAGFLLVRPSFYFYLPFILSILFTRQHVISDAAVKGSFWDKLVLPHMGAHNIISWAVLIPYLIFLLPVLGYNLVTEIGRLDWALKIGNIVNIVISAHDKLDKLFSSGTVINYIIITIGAAWLLIEYVLIGIFVPLIRAGYQMYYNFKIFFKPLYYVNGSPNLAKDLDQESKKVKSYVCIFAWGWDKVWVIWRIFLTYVRYLFQIGIYYLVAYFIFKNADAHALVILNTDKHGGGA